MPNPDPQTTKPCTQCGWEAPDHREWCPLRSQTTKRKKRKFQLEDIWDLIDQLDGTAKLVSNLKKPRTDNRYGVAAAALEDLVGKRHAR